MQIIDLPVELISHILLYTFPSPTANNNNSNSTINPSSILTVNSTFYALGIQIVHRHLCFESIEGMERFIGHPVSVPPPPPSAAGTGGGRRRRRSSAAHGHTRHQSSSTSSSNNAKPQTSAPFHAPLPLSRVPETVEIILPGGLANRKLWSVIKEVFIRCQSGASNTNNVNDNNNNNNTAIEGIGHEDEGVKNVKFILNSHASDPNLHLLHETLGCFNPNSFTWSGPDPDHNFSCAIVPAATSQLFLGLRTWSRLTHLNLSSISFSRCLGRSLLTLNPYTHPHLRTITLSQVVFLHPSSLAMCALQLVGLETLHCEDCYVESIYGPRVRRADVEREFEVSGSMVVGGGGEGTVFGNLFGGGSGVDDMATVGIDPELGAMEGKKRVMEVVRCEARLERLLGGDREVA